MTIEERMKELDEEVKEATRNSEERKTAPRREFYTTRTEKLVMEARNEAGIICH